ncbi:MAG: hypothetical protein RLZZ225_1072 [Pseudomonadota bacterium]|jgi:hypothetical protein
MFNQFITKKSALPLYRHPAENALPSLIKKIPAWQGAILYLKDPA